MQPNMNAFHIFLPTFQIIICLLTSPMPMSWTNRKKIIFSCYLVFKHLKNLALPHFMLICYKVSNNLYKYSSMNIGFNC